MRASANLNNAPIVQQTLAVTMMRGFFPDKLLENIKLIEGNRFADGYPVIEIEAMTYIDSYSLGNLLLDMKLDPKQNKPLNDAKIASQMIEKLIEKMTEIEAPESEFSRLGLKG